MNAAAFHISKLLENRAAFDSEGWQQFFKNSAFRVGLYKLSPNGDDCQEPHAQDEFYFILEGTGILVCESSTGTETFAASPGSLLFVAREVPHRFENFPNGIKALVFFAGSGLRV